MIRYCLLIMMLMSCSGESRKTSQQVETDDRSADKSMGVLYGIVWDTSWDMSSCNSNVLVLQVDLNDDISLFSPPSTSSSLNIFVLPTSSSAASCIIGANNFSYTQAAYRDVLATTNIGCATGKCWQYENNSLTAYVSGSNDPAAGEVWIKKNGNKYSYYNIATTPQQQGIAIKSGSASITHTKSSNTVTVQAIAQQDGSPESGASVVYTISCPNQAPIVLPAVNSDVKGLAKAIKTMTVSSNSIAEIDEINLPTCKVSASINGGTAVDIIAAQTVRPNKSGLPLRISWGWGARITSCNAVDTKVTIIGINSDGSLRRVYNTGSPNLGDVNLLFLPVANTGTSCTIDSTTYTIDSTTFDNTTTAANMGCNADTCWKYDDTYKTHHIFTYKADQFTPAKGEKWIKRTGDRYVFHLVQ